MSEKKQNERPSAISTPASAFINATSSAPLGGVRRRCSIASIALYTALVPETLSVL
jgi:hypothetical protein